MKEEFSACPCFPCFMMENYSSAKIRDMKFFYERKGEFFPEEEYGDFVSVCEKCQQELMDYYYSK